jgi:hydroxymethylpyrimidine/phosphomethylpyrimidine kinase
MGGKKADACRKRVIIQGTMHALPSDHRCRADERPPVLLCVGGHDPSGGAGIVADVQTATALGVHPTSVPTAFTVQDTRNAALVRPLPVAVVEAALDALDADLPARAAKVGLLASPALARAFTRWWRARPSRLPVVLDPVLVASGGRRLWIEGSDPVAALRACLPTVTLLTPNHGELVALTPEVTGDDEESRARRLCALGARAVLVTGGDRPTPAVESTLYDADGRRARWISPRLPGTFHGSGCTLATAVAACLALGYGLRAAVDEGERFTATALAGAWTLGRGGAIPRRSGPWR